MTAEQISPATTDTEAANANGLALTETGTGNTLLRATDRAGGVREYLVERWE